MLGSSTKHYKTYGKRKTNVVNKRVILGDPKSEDNLPRSAPRWSDSDSDDLDEEAHEVRVRPTASREVKKKVVERSKPQKAAPDKENSPTRPRVAATRTCRTLDESETVKDAGATCEELSDLPRRIPLRKKIVAASTRRRAARVVDSEDEEPHHAGLDMIEAQAATLAVEQIMLDTEEESGDPVPSDPESEASVADPSPRVPSLSTLPFPLALRPLLASTLSPEAPRPYDFTSFVESPLAPFSSPSTHDKPWRKIGEASYSEVFSTTSVEGHEIVVKIIPVAPLDKERHAQIDEDVELPNASEWGAIKREIEISRCLGGDEDRKVDGFVHFKGAFLVQGEYPLSLLSAWDRFKAQQKPVCDDQIRPSVLPASQMYALILLDHGGMDLEAWKLRNWREAKEIWDQVVEQLGNAEKEFEFEHRDLHLGNILIAPAPPPPTRTLPERLASLHLTPRKSDPSTSTTQLPTVKATLIDFTLSRLLQPSTKTTMTNSRRSKGKPAQRSTVLFDPFDDDCIFEGDGDSQFDVYRAMRAVVERDGGGWEAFHPRTNLLWLHYLVRKLLEAKRLKTPSLPLPASSLFPSTASSSPGRPVSSPRKTRRHSLLFPATTTAVPPSGSPLATTTSQRKSRTLPAQTHALLSTKQQQRLLSERHRREMVEEVHAWESLKRAEVKLSDVLGDLVEGDVDGERRSRPRKNVGKKKRLPKDEMVDVAVRVNEMSGAADFSVWSSME